MQNKSKGTNVEDNNEEGRTERQNKKATAGNIDANGNVDGKQKSQASHARVIYRNAPQYARRMTMRMTIILCLLALFGLVGFTASHYLEHGFAHFYHFLREIGFASLIALAIIITVGFAEKEERDEVFEAERSRREKDYSDLKLSITKNVDLLDKSARVGLDEIYQTRFDVADDLVADVENSKKSLRMYVGLYFPELFDRSELAQAIAKAVTNKKGSARQHSEKYHVSFTSLSWFLGDDNKWIVRVWNKKEMPRKTIEEFARYMLDSHHRFDRLIESVQRYGVDDNYLQKQSRVFDKYPCPRAMCIVDDEIVYVGIYEWSHSQGTEGPAMRLTGGYSKTWTKIFLEEAKRIDEEFSEEPPLPSADPYKESIS